MDITKLYLLDKSYQKSWLTVTHNTLVMEVIQLMNQAQTSCALVLEQEKLVGIFTERDVVRSLANQISFADMSIAQLMSQPVITVSQAEAENFFTIRQLFQQHCIRHLPVINSQGQVLGVITPSVLERFNAIELSGLVDNLQQTIDTKTAELKREVTLCQEMTKLLSEREASYHASQTTLNDILNSAIATSIVSFRLFPNRHVEYIYQSVGSEALFGYTPSEIISDPNLWMSRVHPQDIETVVMPLFEDIFAGRTVKVEYRFHHKYDSWRWICATYASRYDSQANCWIVTGSSIDISERKHAEETLRHNEERWHLAIAGTDEAIWDWDISTNETFRSERWYEMLGYERHELSNQDHEWSIRIHPDDLERVLAHQQVYLSRQFPDYHVEYRLRRKDGSYGWFRSRAKAVWDEQGNPVRLIGSLGDITERKRIEIALQEREAMLRLLGDNLPNGAVYQVIRELDGSDRFSYLSAGIENLMEVKAEAILQDSSLLYRQFIPEDMTRFQAAFDQSMQNLSVFDMQLRICTPSGQLKWLHLRSSPRPLEYGRVAWDSLVVDVTELKRTEEILRQSEARLEESQRVARLGNWDYDLATGKITWSKELFHLFNRDLALLEPSYEENLALYHPEDQQKLAQAVMRTISTGESYKLVLRATQTDGSMMYIEGIGQAEFNADGQVIRLFGTAQDVSERKRVEQALQEKENFLRSIYDGVGQSIFVVDVVDDNFRFVGLNDAHQQLTGLHSDQLQGKTPEQVFAPAVATTVRRHYQDCLTTKNTITYEECLPFKGQETWWITSLTPLKDENSRIYRIVGSSLNITAQKHAQKMLEMQAVITRNMAEGICLVRVNDGIFVYANPKFEQMFGYESGELIGRHVSIVNYRNEHTTPEELNQQIRSVILQHGEASYEVYNVKKDGTPFWSQATASVFEHPEYGTVIVAVQQDITEHKLAEEKIKTSLKEKVVLLQEIHHQVKNNLGIVSSLLQMQCRRTEDVEATAILRDSQNRIASIALVHEKLYRSTDLANINFAQYIPNLTTHLFDSYHVSSNYIKLNIQVDDVSLDIETAIPCGLIINELVSNALKHAFPDNGTGEIHLSLNQQNQHEFILIIRDNGIGLPVDFDSKKLKTLGITLVRGLVQQLRGSIEISSQQGTEFKITFTKSKA